MYADLETYFPAQFQNVLSLQFWMKQKEKNIKQLEAIISGKPDPTIEKIDNYFAYYIKPKNFYGSGSEELKHDRSFEQNCIVLSKYANKDVKACTTKEYFSLLNHHNNLIKEERRSQKK